MRSRGCLHLASRYDVKQRSIMARVRSTETGTALPSGSNPPGNLFALWLFSVSESFCSSFGFKSLIVKQARHLNLSSAFGTETFESQHMHLLATLLASSSSFMPFLPLMIRFGGAGLSSITGTRSSSRGTSLSRKSRVLFFRPKILGSGWLADLLW